VAETDWTAADATALHVLAVAGGVAHVRAFLDAGLTRHQVAALFRRGVLERPRIGWYVDPALPWQGKRAVRVGGVADCVTAAALWGLPVPPGSHEVLHVRVALDATRLRHNRDRTWVVHAADDHEVHVHRDVLVDPALWRTSLVDTLLELSRCVPLDWFVCALDAALHRPRDGSREPLLSEAELARLAVLLPRRRRRALDLVDARAESPLETLLRLGLRRRGIAPFDPQFRPTKRYCVDFLIHGRLVVETDGAAFHDPVRDARRDAELRALGYRILRFGYDAVVFDLDTVLDAIERELLLLSRIR
jgi:very-short-patch-repair endonuclease